MVSTSEIEDGAASSMSLLDMVGFSTGAVALFMATFCWFFLELRVAALAFVLILLRRPFFAALPPPSGFGRAVLDFLLFTPLINQRNYQELFAEGTFMQSLLQDLGRKNRLPDNYHAASLRRQKDLL